VSQGKPDAIVNYKAKLGSWVNVPAELVVSKSLQSRDVVMCSLIKGENRSKLRGKFTYPSLSKIAHNCVKTARRAVLALEDAQWLHIKERKNHMAPIEFKLESPCDRYCREQIKLTQMRLNRPGNHGEAIALAMVMLAVVDTECVVGGRSNKLPSPITGELMEVDIRLLEHNLAIEFNGMQHYAPTSSASAEDVAKQQKRDAVKATLLGNMKHKVLILTAADLSIATIVEKLGGLVPLRDLRFYQPLVNFLNNVGQSYQDKAKRLQALEVSPA
jgi:hypothetical protein